MTLTRVACIEVSHWHAFNAPSYVLKLRQITGVEIVGLHDPDRAIVARRAAEIGNPPAFTDIDAMLDQSEPDFVLALGRHDRMAAIAHRLIDRGLPFIMEKPMGLNAVEVAGIAARAAATGSYVAVPFPTRLSPFFARAAALLAEGSLGPVSHIYIRINRETSARYRTWESPWMLDPALSGGGCLRNLGIHGFDAFLALTAEPAEVVGAQVSRKALGEAVEDYASVLVRSQSGVLGTIEAGNLFPNLSAPKQPLRLFAGGDGDWKIAGRDGLLMARDGKLRLVTGRADESTPEPEAKAHPSLTILTRAIARWRAGEAPETGVEDCLRAVRLVDDAYRMAGPEPRFDRREPSL